MLRKFQYIRFTESGRYFCLQQSPFMLFWVLFFKKNTICSTSIFFKKYSARWIKIKIRKYIFYFYTGIFTFIGFIIYKFGFQNIGALVELPVYGQICILVNKGYKVFDHRRGIVIKVYRDDVDMTTIANEIEFLQKGYLFDFAPSIRRINIKERWYEEEYFIGSLDHSGYYSDQKTLLKKFYKYIVPCLESLILSQSPIVKNTFDYVCEMKNILVTDTFWRDEFDVKKRDKILDFIHVMDERVHSEGNLSLFLVLTHGDFCPANMLNTRHGIKVIDWESAIFRSALFDFYSYLFFRPLHQTLSLDKLSREINVTLSFYLSKLDVITPDISESLKSSERMYRWFFYIERIFMLVEREKHDTKLNIMDEMLYYIEVFNSYEEISAKDAVKI